MLRYTAGQYHQSKFGWHCAEETLFRFFIQANEYHSWYVLSRNSGAATFQMVLTVMLITVHTLVKASQVNNTIIIDVLDLQLHVMQ